ncbi:hypothetical protein FXO37_11170 [Capsicum annuum]|nr:hypothetical protein FXO37_11170 [Capsicum annuum]
MAFVKRRQIIDAALIASECIDTRTRGEEAGLMCKLNIGKAYDHVAWCVLGLSSVASPWCSNEVNCTYGTGVWRAIRALWEKLQENSSIKDGTSTSEDTLMTGKWRVWKERNDRCFEDETKSVHDVKWNCLVTIFWCTFLYDTLRPKLIHESNLDALCELVDILKVEVLGEQLSRRGESLAGLRPTLDRILADVHERLTFRARTYIRDEIANYLPSDQDLDYPKMLEQSVSAELGSPSTEQNHDVSGTWYPPLEKTISCLSKLYCSLESAVFTGLAQEVVEFCSLSIQKASKLIGKRASSMDAQLFLIKHLLILREQIAPFDIEFSVTHKELDFSHLLNWTVDFSEFTLTPLISVVKFGTLVIFRHNFADLILVVTLADTAHG